MRFDKEIYFQTLTNTYDPETGDYSSVAANEVQRFADISNTNTEMLQLVYGNIKQKSLTIRLQNHYDQPFNYIRVGSTRYKVDHTKQLRTKQVFVVSEVQGNAD